MATDLEVALGEKLALAEHRYQRLVEEVKALRDDAVRLKILWDDQSRQENHERKRRKQK